MKKLLADFYIKEDMGVISKAFNLRNIAQYYVDKIIDTEEANLIMSKAPLFVDTSKDVLSKINEGDINKIKDSLENFAKIKIL